MLPFGFAFYLTGSIMNLQQYVNAHGSGRLIALAHLTGKSRSYFLNLLYALRNDPLSPKRPSMSLASELVLLTDGKLTMEGLAAPVPMTSDVERPRMPYGFMDVIKRSQREDLIRFVRIEISATELAALVDAERLARTSTDPDAALAA